MLDETKIKHVMVVLMNTGVQGDLGPVYTSNMFLLGFGGVVVLCSRFSRVGVPGRLFLRFLATCFPFLVAFRFLGVFAPLLDVIDLRSSLVLAQHVLHSTGSPF